MTEDEIKSHLKAGNTIILHVKSDQKYKIVGHSKCKTSILYDELMVPYGDHMIWEEGIAYFKLTQHDHVIYNRKYDNFKGFTAVNG